MKSNNTNQEESNCKYVETKTCWSCNPPTEVSRQCDCGDEENCKAKLVEMCEECAKHN